ncbi:MAG TPA: GNAT family N-acetyltransferase, partial [Gammaproteobacteria bacterium]|nr:GNAT family N-acetyltransferase [Gammaproteobacteria bacterium]
APDAAHGIYTQLSDLPEVPDLAVVAVPASQVPETVGELGSAGTRAAVVLSAGFEEIEGEAGVALQQAALEAAKPYLMRIIGPNCLGILMPKVGLNASFAHLMARPGNLAFIAQSGAILTAVVDWAESRGIGFSALISLGASADVDFGDLLDYLANDWDTRAILLYVESVRDSRKFMSAARLAARLKPVIVVKGGRYAQSAQAVASHTGALAGVDAVYAAAFRRAGMVQVDSMAELFDAVETLGHSSPRFGERLAIVTNGGGIGVLATDELTRLGGNLAALSENTRHRLREALPPLCSTQNPIDVLGDADPGRYRDTLRILYEAPEVDTVAVFNCPVGVASSQDAAEAVIEVHQTPRKGLLTNWLGAKTAQTARERFTAHRIPTYETPDQVVRAYMHLIGYRRNQRLLLETPPSLPQAFVPDSEAARAVIETARERGGGWLSLAEGMELLAAYRIPVVQTAAVVTPDEAAAQAADWAVPVALKISSPDILHKRAMGGVALNLQTPEAVSEAAQGILAHLRQHQPEARIEGFTLQPMVPKGDNHELILGMTTDPVFGPVLLFGQGGNAVEALNDTAFALPPLNMHLACDLIERTRIHRVLRGVGGIAATRIGDVALSLVKLAQLAADLPEVVEIEVNPLLAGERGVLALDARVRVDVSAPAGDAHFAIRPYPKELEQSFELSDGHRLMLRPIQPEDEPALIQLFDAMTEEERYMRFFSPMSHVPHQLAARLSQIDYHREMALILTEAGLPGQARILAGVRIAGDPNDERCEFAIGVRHDQGGKGLGIRLMQRIIDYARARGYREIYGDILRENGAMLAVCRKLGFHIDPGSESNIVRATLTL